MNSTSTHFVTSRRMNIYEPLQQINSWVDTYRDDTNVSIAAIIQKQEKMMDNQSAEDTSHGGLAPSDQEASKTTYKAKRRLAQNREAARKSRLRKKAYVQQLESSRIKLIQMEQELQHAKQQGLYLGGGVDKLPFSEPVNSGIAAFEMKYEKWVEEQNRQICDLRTSLQGHVADVELRILVESVMRHYLELFQMKATATKVDDLYVMTGVWRTSAERFFLWIGGFRPSELLKVLVPQLDLSTEQQVLDVYSLKISCQQAEDALSQGMERLHQNLSETVATGQLGESSHPPHTTSAMGKLGDLVKFLNQADHLRQETLHQMHRILTTRQAARGLLALGEYFQRLRALSSLVTHPSLQLVKRSTCP